MGAVFRAFAAMKDGQPVLQAGCLRLFASAEAAEPFGIPVRVMLDDIPDRREPGMFMWPAEAYLDAAKKVRDAPPDRTSRNAELPIEFLLGHSIELSLKAMLRAAGTPTTEEARAIGAGRRPMGPTIEEYGHDLVRLTIDCIRRGLAAAVQLTPEDIDLIARFNDEFQVHVARYPAMGLRSGPSRDALFDLAGRIALVARVNVERDARERRMR